MEMYFLISIVIHIILFAGLLRLHSVSQPVYIEADFIHSTASTSHQSKEQRQAKVRQLSPAKLQVQNISNSQSTDTSEASVDSAGTGAPMKMPQVLKEIKARYPLAAKKSQIEGEVLLSVLVNAKGEVENAEVLRGPGYGLNEAALQALKEFSFSPALKEGKPVRAQIQYRYQFRLE